MLSGIATNFNQAFKVLQRITALSVALLFISNIIWVFVFTREVEQMNNKIYVVADNGTMSAVAAETAKPSVYEAKNHIKTFMSLMFSNDAENFKERINMALKMIERQDGLAIYESFKRGQVLENYAKYNSRTLLTIDSVRVNMAVEPYSGMVYCKQTVVYEKEKKIQAIAAKFELTRTLRSDENPFGLMLDKFAFIQYNPPLKPE